MLVVRRSGEVIAKGLNKNYKNPVLHSEIVAITQAVEQKHIVDWSNTVLYTTAEPSPMGMTAILWTGIPTVIYGSTKDTLQHLGFRQVDIPAQEIIDRAINLDCQLIAGVQETKCDELFNAAAKIDKV